MSLKEKTIQILNNRNTGGDGWAQANAQAGIAYAILELADAIRSIDTSEKRTEEN